MNASPPTFLSLFAGIGGFDLALERSGFRCIGQVEIDSFCTRVLAARFLHAPRSDDVRWYQGNGHEPPDLLVGGFPCQDFSVAGKRAGLVGYRGTLFWEIIRIAKELCPAWGLFENVPGLLSANHGRDFWAVLQGLRECWPAVGWRVLDSCYFGVAQRRRRVFLVCGSSEAAVASVLFEPEGGGGHPAAGGEAGADIAHALARGTSRSGTRFDPNSEDFVVMATINSGGNQGGFRTEPGEHLVAHALCTEQGTPLIWPIQEVGGRENKKQHGEGMCLSDQDVMYSLQAAHQHGVASPASVRRLTLMECERLQGFPDGWTCLCQPIEHYAADPEEAAWNCRCPDGPRYRALGNAVTVTVVEWIGWRLLETMVRVTEAKGEEP